MSEDAWSDLAILRRCVRCRAWRSIEDFAHARHSKRQLCVTCVLYGPHRTKPRYLVRSITITPLGKADLARWRKEEAAVA